MVAVLSLPTTTVEGLHYFSTNSDDDTVVFPATVMFPPTETFPLIPVPPATMRVPTPSLC
jgi:hypothetical protein